MGDNQEFVHIQILINFRTNELRVSSDDNGHAKDIDIV